MRPPSGRSTGGTSGVWHTHQPGNRVLTQRDLSSTMRYPATSRQTAATRRPARTAGGFPRLPSGASVLAAVREPGRAELEPGTAVAELGVVALEPGRAEIMAGGAELDLGGVELEVGDGELERGRGGVPAAPPGHRGGERAGPGLGDRDPV